MYLVGNNTIGEGIINQTVGVSEEKDKSKDIASSRDVSPNTPPAWSTISSNIVLLPTNFNKK